MVMTDAAVSFLTPLDPRTWRSCVPLKHWELSTQRPIFISQEKC